MMMNGFRRFWAEHGLLKNWLQYFLIFIFMPFHIFKISRYTQESKMWNSKNDLYFIYYNNYTVEVYKLFSILRRAYTTIAS